MSTLYFIIPDYTRFVSGGNLYNQHLIEALKKQADCSIIVWTMEELRMHFNGLRKGLFFVDTLYLAQISSLLYFKNPTQRFYLIVHHLQSLFPPAQYTSTTYFEEKEKRILQLFDGFLTTSQHTATYLSANGLKQDRIVAPPALIISPNSTPSRQAHPIKALLVANVVRRKGILPFLMACKQLSGTALTIEIAGSRSLEIDYATRCTAIVQEHPFLKNYIHFLDTLSPQTMQSKYQACNLLISSSFFETYGMALQEGVAWGLPILAIKGGNVANHIEEGENGYLFENALALVKKLTNLAEDRQKMALLLKRAANYKGKQSLTWSALAKDLLLKVGAF